jgi:hypothetical protein
LSEDQFDDLLEGKLPVAPAAKGKKLAGKAKAPHESKRARPSRQKKLF